MSVTTETASPIGDARSAADDAAEAAEAAKIEAARVEANLSSLGATCPNCGYNHHGETAALAGSDYCPRCNALLRQAGADAQSGGKLAAEAAPLKVTLDTGETLEIPGAHVVEEVPGEAPAEQAA